MQYFATPSIHITIKVNNGKKKKMQHLFMYLQLQELHQELKCKKKKVTCMW